MTLLTRAHLLDRYGPLLTEAQLGEVLHPNRNPQKKTCARTQCVL